MEQDPLGLDPDTMRQIGHRVVDWLVDREERRHSEPVLQRATTSEMAERLGGPAPSGGSELEAVLKELDEAVLPFRSRIDHPRYLAYVPGSGTWPGALADLVASTYNIDVGNWMESAGPEPARADRARLVRLLDRLPRHGSRGARVRRLGGEPDGARLCAGVAGRPDAGGPRGLRLRPGTLLARPGGARPGLRPAPGAGAALRRGSDADPCAGRRRTQRPRRRTPAAGRAGRRRHHQHRGRRPVGRAVRDLPGAQSVAARRRGVRRLRHHHRAR